MPTRAAIPALARAVVGYIRESQERELPSTLTAAEREAER
jgi:hypothetical protein